MEEFLKSVEKKAFGMIQVAVGDPEDALDLLQDSMMKFVQKYALKPEAEWKPLFYRIVQNSIRDWYRRQKIKKLIFTFLPTMDQDRPEFRSDPLQSIPDLSEADPLSELNASQTFQAVDSALKELPSRQQQVFLLRAWEGLNVQDTARVMKCSQGTVKTHYSRAVNRLRQALEGDGI